MDVGRVRVLGKRAARRREAEELGAILARLHWQCWRADPPPVEVTEAEFIAVMPIVIKSGSVGLVWPRMRERFDPEGAVALAMEAAFAAQVAHNQKVERDLAAVVTRLRKAGIEPLLIKGLAVARHYPPGLVRPAGDIDLVVQEEEFARAEAIVTEPCLQTVGVDLKQPAIWDERPSDIFRDQAVNAVIGNCTVRVLGVDDQLRMQCFHYWKHRGMRLLWVCDLALLLEHQRKELDWDQILLGSRFDVDRIRTLVGVAQMFLGCSLDQARRDCARRDIPTWLGTELFKEWANVDGYAHDALIALRADPGRVVNILTERWSSPIHATLQLRMPFNSLPRLPIQIVGYGLKLARFPFRELPRQIRSLQTRKVAPPI